ncbi:hypothetical protein PybrP1_006802 [[Pythium] brassicae (nom. inval.)]|nr:hypothetical protein PybrP1_006802 [[Pythium] brassicae (nom. inval.)]
MSRVLALLSVAVSVFIGANAGDVCTLPAASLFLPATNASAALARCWSDSVGMTVFAPCVFACACRRLEVANNQERGACLNSSASFRCSNSGGTDCSAYALNADGTSMLRSRGSSEITRPPASATMPPAESANTTKENSSKGVAAWLWAVIIVALVLGVALAVFAVSWFRRRSDPAKHDSDTLERTESVDAWKDAEVLDAQGGPSATAAPTEGATQRHVALNLAEVSGLSASVGYHTYRVGSTPGQYERFSTGSELASQPQQHQEQALEATDSDDDLSSVELHARSHISHDSYSTRRSSLADAGERLTGGSRLSYVSTGSYGSEMDSFTSQLTLEDAEPRDPEPASDAYYHAHPPQHPRFFVGASDASYARKKSTEF